MTKSQGPRLIFRMLSLEYQKSLCPARISLKKSIWLVLKLLYNTNQYQEGGWFRSLWCKRRQRSDISVCRDLQCRLHPFKTSLHSLSLFLPSQNATERSGSHKKLWIYWGRMLKDNLTENLFPNFSNKLNNTKLNHPYPTAVCSTN